MTCSHFVPFSSRHWPAALLIAGLMAIAVGCDKPAKSGRSPQSSAEQDAGGNQAEKALKPLGPPATVDDARAILDLQTFPRLPGAAAPTILRLARLTYEAPDDVIAAYKFQRKELLSRGWHELPDGHVGEQSASGIFARAGFRVSVTVMPASAEGRQSSISIQNHANIDLGQLPKPPNSQLTYASPISETCECDFSAKKVADGLQTLLKGLHWLPYGHSADAHFFKRNGVKLIVRIAPVGIQDAKATLEYGSEQLSVDLPAPPRAEEIEYLDTAGQLSFASPDKEADLETFYRQELAYFDWHPTTDKPTRAEWRKKLVFRHPNSDLLTLETYEEEGKTRATLKYQSAAELAALQALEAAAKKNLDPLLESGRP